MSGKDAYIDAYDTKGNADTVYVEATRLLAREDIQEYIKHLRKPLEINVQTQALSEYEKLKALAWERIEECKANNDDSGIARYMDIINKMSGTYININLNIEDKTTEIDLLDADTLKRLAEA
jgi:hypothetical protein